MNHPAPAKPMVTDVFVKGAVHGWNICVTSTIPNVLMAFVIIKILNHSGLLALIGQIFSPIMGIFGLPGEDEEMMLDSVRRINELPIESIKFHHLQILRGTELGRQWERGQLRDIISYTPERYAALCRRVLALLRPDIAVERLLSQSPRHLVLHPRWNLKPSAFAKALDERLDERLPAAETQDNQLPAAETQDERLPAAET